MRARSLLIAAALLLGVGVGPTAGASQAECAAVTPAGTAAQRAQAAKVRVKYFGAQHVDERTGAVDCTRMYVAWINNSSLAASLNGHVVLFDAFFPTHHPGYIPTDAWEMGDLLPEYLFIGHGHYDHAQEAPRVLNRSRRTVLVGTPEHCEQIRTALQGKFTPKCVAPVKKGAALGSRGTLDGLIRGVKISVVTVPHSAADTPDPANPKGPYGPTPFVPAYRSRLAHPPAPIGTPDRQINDGVRPGDGAEGGDILYQFRLGSFSFVYHDTSGPVRVGDATWTSLRALPPTDVEYAAVVAFDTATVGFRDSRIITEALRTREFSPLHHDDWNEALGSEAWSYEDPVRAEFAKIPAERRPRIDWLFDPSDYLAGGVRSWNPAAKTWKNDFKEPARSEFEAAEDDNFLARYAMSRLQLKGVWSCATLAAGQADAYSAVATLQNLQALAAAQEAHHSK
ncbi:MAG: hypothetical protein JWN55_2629 [Frankiales bacterium]|nr:hypothetical protein [Frankiales bacterium]